MSFNNKPLPNNPGGNPTGNHRTRVVRSAPSSTFRASSTGTPAPAGVPGTPSGVPGTYRRSFRPQPGGFQSKSRGGFSRGGGRRPPMRSSSRVTEPKNTEPIPPLAPGDLRVIPLGGVEEIQKNMTMVEYKDQIVVIDAGTKFSDDETPGINCLIPNTKYLEERKDKIKALVITHGHLDHIGAIPYVMDKLGNPPIYTREFGALLIKKRQEEFPQNAPLDIRIVEKDDGSIKLSDDIKVRFFGLTHSIPDSTGVIIETPCGDIVSTGDVRVENTDGVPSEKEIEQYKFFKDRNVLLMTMDSTGIPVPGWSVSERLVVETVDKIIRDTKGRLIIGTFASQVERIVEFIKSAKKYGKVVVIEGRAMKTNMSIVKHLGLTDLDHVIDVEDMPKHPPNKIMMLATGAQGEEYSALDRMGKGTHKQVTLVSTDTIVLSSSVIPGNEPQITRLKDNLYRKDPKIITYSDSTVHASGHGKRNELEWIHKQITYKYFMPIHGSHSFLKMHRDMVVALGFPREKIVVPDNGTIVEFRKGGEELVVLPMKAPSEEIAVDGNHIGDMYEAVMRDRKTLADEGFFIIVSVIDQKTKRLKKSPDIISRGSVYLRGNQELLHKMRGLVKHAVEESAARNQMDIDRMKDDVTEKLSRFILQQTEKRPIIIPVILAF